MVVGGGIITVVTLMVCSGDGSAGYFDGELGTRCRTGTAAVAALCVGVSCCDAPPRTTSP